MPAVVILSQIMLESGWGTSNITILKNNLMGIGNATREEDFVARLELPGFTRDIPVHCMKDTTAYSFENIADSVFYYVYVLLQSPDNALHYGELREYIRENRVLRQNAPKTYRKRVIELIADSYHSDPDWYAGYLTRFARRFDKVLSP
ncbi:MAG: glucosaminidase domain-containing protein [Candidatus Sumerlaeota bacterium]